MPVNWRGRDEDLSFVWIEFCGNKGNIGLNLSENRDGFVSGTKRRGRVWIK